MTISYGLCWNIDSRKIIWPPRAHYGSENESLKGLTVSYFRTYIYVRNPKTVATPVRIYTYDGNMGLLKASN